MAIEVFELWKSRSVKVGREKQAAYIEFFARGSSDDALIRAAIAAVTPPTFYGLNWNNTDIQPEGGLSWTGTAIYESSVMESIPGQGGSSGGGSGTAPGNDVALAPGFSMEIGNTTERVYEALERVYDIRIGGVNVAAAAKTKAINETADGTVEGVDILRPTFEWAVSRSLGFITLDYCRTIDGLVGKVNDDTFWGWDKGEVMFLGCSAYVKGINEVECNFKFRVIQNEINIDIDAANGLTIPTKEGHEYLWVRYKEAIDIDNLTLVPYAAVLDKVSEYGDFSLLAIGV